jgi:hypothetical protein
MIVFVNCCEEMAVGMRILAAMAVERGFAAHLVVIHGYKTVVSDALAPRGGNANVCVNGKFHVNQDVPESVTTEEMELFARRLGELAPEMLCFSARSKNDGIMAALIRKARAVLPEVPILCGGYGPTYNPLPYLTNGADLVVWGEGETAFAAILERHAAGKSLADAPNIIRLEEGREIRNPPAPVLRDLSPVPDPLAGDELTSFIDGNRIMARDPAYDDKNYNILLGRGCIADCHYCAAPVLRKAYKREGALMPRYRKRSHESALRELERAKARGVTQVTFKDEYLVAGSGELTAFFTEYGRRIGLPFKANLHHEQLLRHPALLRAALDAGLRSYPLGFQAGSERVARERYNRPHAFADLLALGKLLFEEFVLLQYHFVSGTSINTEEELRDKFELIKALPFDPLHLHRAMLFDFQFFPQPLSHLTRELGKTRLRRVSTEEWAEKALLCQVRRVADDAVFSEIAERYEKDRLSVEELRAVFSRCHEDAKAARRAALCEELAGREVFFLTDDEVKEKEIERERESLPACLRSAHIVRRVNMYAEGAEKGDLEEIRQGEGLPVVLATRDNILSARRLRRTFSLRNRILPVEKIPDAGIAGKET